jgi:sugar phosphate isomerase/epimerase
MRIGFYTAILGELNIEEAIKWAGQVGFGSLEISAWPESKHINLERAPTLEEIKKRAEEQGIAISNLGYYPNNLEANETKRATHHKHLRNLIAAAGESGVGIVSTFAGANSERDFEGNIRDFVETFGPIADLAKQVQVRIAIENSPMVHRGMPTNLAYSPENWAIMFKELGAENVGLELDPAPLVWQLIDPVLAAREFSQKVFVIHLKDTEVLKKRLNEVGIIGQGWWRYRLPGFGQIDWPGFFKSLAEGGFQGCMNIEHEDPVYSGREDRIKEGLVKALAFAKKSIG